MVKKIFPTVASALLVAGTLSVGSSRLPVQAQAEQPAEYNCLTREVWTPEKRAWCEAQQNNEANLAAVIPAELEINSDTAAFSDRTLTSGPIQITVSYTPAERTEVGENLQYQISYEGSAETEAAVETYYFANLALQDLDSDGIAEVVVQNYSGGAHCCTNTVIYSWQEGEFKSIETGYSDGTGGAFEDLNNDGLSEFVSYDNRFLYRFSSYAGSYPPPRILTFQGGELTETTAQFPDVIRERITQIEEIFADASFNREQNGVLAGYVAMKSLVGEGEEGWDYMLDRYDVESDWGLAIRNEEGEELGTYPNFPTALAAFLDEAGY